MRPTPLDNFRGNIRLRRIAAGLSQEELSERAGVGKTTVWRFETQRVDIMLGSVTRIADALGVTVAQLDEPLTAEQRRYLASKRYTGTLTRGRFTSKRQPARSEINGTS